MASNPNIENVCFDYIYDGKKLYELIFQFPDKKDRLVLQKMLSPEQKYQYTKYRNLLTKKAKLQSDEEYKLKLSVKQKEYYMKRKEQNPEIVKERNREYAKAYRERKHDENTKQQLKEAKPTPKEEVKKEPKDRKKYMKAYYLKRKALKEANEANEANEASS